MNANQPAYPFQATGPDGLPYGPHDGLTKRELIAAMALQGFCMTLAGGHMALSLKSLAKTKGTTEQALLCGMAVQHADALLAQLERTAK